MRKVLVIGLDGGTLDVLLPLIEQGRLPALKRLMDRGAWGRLRTVIPPGTGPAWSSIITGYDPSNHGIADLIVRAPASYDLAFLNALALRAPTVWDVVGRLGGKVLVLNVPMTYPARAVSGSLISGLDTPAGAGGSTYPPEFLDTVKAIEPGYRITPSEAYVPGRDLSFLDDLASLVRAKAHVLNDLLRSAEWDFAMQVFSETDFLQHALWHVMDETHPRHRPGDSEECRARAIELYESLDRAIGEAAEVVGEEGSVLVLSDHGAGPLHEFIHANNILVAMGFMKVRGGPLARAKHALFRSGFTPLAVYRLASALGLGKARMGLRWTSKGYGLLRRFFFSFSDIDWKRTRAYAISGGVYGGIFVNLEGREPEGAVPPGDYERTRQELKQMLVGLRHPATGKALVKQVMMREDIYRGRFLEELPDLYFLPSDATQAVFGDFEFSSNRTVEPASEAISAQHRMDGLLVVKGPGIKPGADLDGITVVDTTPLALYLMGLPIPEGLDGKLHPGLFAPGELDRRPPAYSKAEGGAGHAGGPRESTDDESIKERLKGLGYIS